jgi:hypothetical protein
MIRTIAIAIFGLTLASAVEAMPVGSIRQLESTIPQVREGCGPGMVMAGGVCVSRHNVRQARRCARWNGSVCAHWY